MPPTHWRPSRCPTLTGGHRVDPHLTCRAAASDAKPPHLTCRAAASDAKPPHLTCRAAASDAKPLDVYILTDPREVEILSRCCRVWYDMETLDKDAVKLAAKVGLLIHHA